VERDPGVVDDDVEPRCAGVQQQLLVEPGEQRVDVAVGAERLADRERLPAAPDDRAHDLVGGLRAGRVVDGDERAVARQSLRDRPADPARGAGDQRDLALQFCSHR
jgi:hypothetical protein